MPRITTETFQVAELRQDAIEIADFAERIAKICDRAKQEGLTAIESENAKSLPEALARLRAFVPKLEVGLRNSLSKQFSKHERNHRGRSVAEPDRTIAVRVSGKKARK